MFELKPSSVARWSVAFVFAYHGLVPKLLLVHPSEIDLVKATPTLGLDPSLLVRCAGIAEVLLALVIIVCWKKAWPLFVAGCALIGLLGATVVFVPSVMGAAFNPVSLTVTTLALVWIALTGDRNTPTPS